MKLTDIVENSNYVTDEELNDNNLVGMANSAIAEVNSKCSTNLPFFVQENVSTTPYNAIKSSWVLRLIEPYLSYSIAANDTNSNDRDFHYNRFLQAIIDFKEKGLDSILTIDPSTGEETGWAGNSSNMAIIDASEVTMHWKGWF